MPVAQSFVRKLWIAAAACALSSLPANAQTPGPARRIESLERQVEAMRSLLHDWAGLIRYGSENTEIPPPAPGEQRVVFLGDETTERWGKGEAPFFPGKPYFNRGISGQTTPQMLVRFRQDVISLKPKTVVILAGMNDIAAVTGPGTQGMMIENFMSMVELAKVNHIAVVLASILPVCDCFQNRTALRPIGKIRGMNAWLKEYAAQIGAVYLDYFSALAENGVFNKKLTSDGLLPNDAGYNVMAPLAQRAIAEALANNAAQTPPSTEPRASEGVKKSVERVAQPRKGRQSNSPRRPPWEKQVGEKAQARATDPWGFIDDPDRTLRLSSEHLRGRLSRQESVTVSRKVPPFRGSAWRLALPRLTPWASTLTPLTGLGNTFYRMPDSFSASRGVLSLNRSAKAARDPRVECRGGKFGQ
jgi:lysophospholipase L1-like esterase